MTEGPPTEELQAVERAATEARALEIGGQWEQAIALLAGLTTTHDVTRMRVLTELAFAYRGRGNVEGREGAIQLLEEALTLARQTDQALDEALILGRLETSLRSIGAFAQSRSRLEELIAKLRAIEPQGHALRSALSRLVTTIAVRQRRPSEAVGAAEEWLDVSRRLGEGHNIAGYFCAWIFGAAGRLTEARALALERLAMLRPGEHSHYDAMRLLSAIEARDIEGLQSWGGSAHASD